jgi:hypothetical protein
MAQRSMESGGGGHGATGSAYTNGRGSSSASPDADLPRFLPTGSFYYAMYEHSLTMAWDDQVHEKPTGLPKSTASVMGIKLEKSNEQMDKLITLNQIEEQIKKSSWAEAAGAVGASPLLDLPVALYPCPILRDTTAICVVVPLILLVTDCTDDATRGSVFDGCSSPAASVMSLTASSACWLPTP